MTLKQSQGHQTYNENADPKQGYKHAKFERSCLNGGGFFLTRKDLGRVFDNSLRACAFFSSLFF